MSEAGAGCFGGGLYVYKEKLTKKTRNPVVNAVADKAVRSFGGGVYV